MSPAVEFWITLLFGWMGAHKFAQGKIGVGFLYLFTIGLFMFGWISDSCKAGKRYFSDRRYQAALRNKPSQLCAVPAPGLVRQEDEHCVYYGPAQQVVTKNLVTGHVREGGGASVRVMPGLSVGRTTGVSHTIREDVTSLLDGTLYVTDRRIVFACDAGGFSYPVERLTSLGVAPGIVTLQFNGKAYRMLVSDAPWCSNVLEGVINGVPILQ